jgi:hypothetical protein
VVRYIVKLFVEIDVDTEQRAHRWKDVQLKYNITNKYMTLVSGSEVKFDLVAGLLVLHIYCMPGPMVITMR